MGFKWVESIGCKGSSAGALIYPGQASLELVKVVVNGFAEVIQFRIKRSHSALKRSHFVGEDEDLGPGGGIRGLAGKKLPSQHDHRGNGGERYEQVFDRPRGWRGDLEDAQWNHKWFRW